MDTNKELMERIIELENAVNHLGNDVKLNKKRKFPAKQQATILYSITRALCVETVDPWKENRVRFFHPLLHDPKTPLLGLPFASPVSSMGGIDDCGLNWVPPAGSALMIFFEGGVRESPFYIGTTWNRNRGPDGQQVSQIFPSREYEAVYKGHRKGYLVGNNDESQVFAPWNTESYNGTDIDSIEDFTEDPNEQRHTTYPNIYGFKTPEKHMFKMVDGDAKCNRRWKRVEIMSGCGNWMIFKDDHLHYGGQWANPKCPPNPGGAAIVNCAETSDNPFYTDFHGNAIEKSGCSGKVQSEVLGGHSSTPHDPRTKYTNSQVGSNKFFKHANECRPYKGPGTPQNNRCQLPQTGIQLLSISGHTMFMDDSVEEPRGKPEWERSLEDFDYGCNDKYLGIMGFKSSTGHSIVLSDIEEPSKVRGKDNFIRLKSAAGNKIELNDHTVGSAPEMDDGECPACPPFVAGPERGIHFQSTSNHQINMVDDRNEQCAPCRSEGGVPVSKATRAYMQLKSGYGLEMRFNDDFSQQETQQQWIQITNPQCVNPNTDDNCNSCPEPECRGPHFMRFQGRPKGEPGVVFLRAGGHSIRQTYDMDIVLVGDKELNPSDKFTYVSKKYITSSEDVHFRYSGEKHVFFAEKNILLMAGRDCPPPEEDPTGCKGPCLYSVIVARCPVICHLTGILHWTERSASERVFASAYHPCQGSCPSNCDEYEARMAQAKDPPCEDCTEKTINTGEGPITICTPDQPPEQNPKQFPTLDLF